MPAKTADQPKLLTWRDYMEPDDPEPKTLTRPEFVERLRTEGIEVTPRTLAYWEEQGIVPRSVRKWIDGAPRSLYPEWMLDVVRTVRGMQDKGASLEQIRHAVHSTPWRIPMAPPGTPPTSPVEFAARFRAYLDAAEALAPQLANLARLRELAYGVRILDVAVQFRDAAGSTDTHSFGAPYAWPGDDVLTEYSPARTEEYSTVDSHLTEK